MTILKNDRNNMLIARSISRNSAVQHRNPVLNSPELADHQVKVTNIAARVLLKRFLTGGSESVTSGICSVQLCSAFSGTSFLVLFPACCQVVADGKPKGTRPAEPTMLLH